MTGGIERLGRALARVGANVALAIASVLVTLVLFEAFAREFMPGWAPPAGDRRFWTFDRELGWHHRPGQEGVHRHRDFEVSVRIGEHGLRDRSYPKDRTPDRPRMLVLGDSFGWGHGVEFHEMASELLEARYPNWEIINASVSGYGTDQQLLWYRNEGRAYAPDVVLQLFHPNDFLDNHRWSRYGYRKPVFELATTSPELAPELHPLASLELTRVPVARRNWDDRLDRWLYLHSWLYPRLLELPDIISEFRLRPEPKPTPVVTASMVPPAPPKRPRRDRQLDDEHLEITRRLVLSLAREVEDSGARLVTASVPMPEHLGDLFARFLADADVPHLPLDDAFREAKRSNPDERLHYRHDPHWTPAGQRVAADAIERFLLELGLFPELPEPPARVAMAHSSAAK
ncbi:MAG: SGNH/GDSL hydrolase family protein [Myxococcota bacterium]|nr:SGNH/GDSL hydrolase family protein [Myxococcota bacterium]